ncbi:site-specific DNA-methyltransferase [Nocardioides daphniae]|uniref:Site-specific DNA-methyltransferase n=1 Tax=Nocardioides daphniae TaxID=402297 RepID=A0A4P7UIV0_9ACTN|nr:DNA methyltransferase [Nocardioides daphniae]QCC78419.1 site-specific DNA-methyltransferase [Nocardioides daphniae]GGD12599.1 hypothetical protein GCM10007231_09500 [Nocardioides daphniae]
MSRLSDLLKAVENLDPQLGKDLISEIAPIRERVPFGLNFERHVPEAVQLPGHPIRKGSKVHVLPPRGSTARGDRRLWAVRAINQDLGTVEIEATSREGVESRTVHRDDLVLVAEFSDHIYPGLRLTDSVQRSDTKPFHTVINGENYHVLEQLTFTHGHSVDAIYIDPPYNTGARDWKYNNDYVESDDLYRHSKWLAFMERRLKLAERLLNPDDSVLILAIDENEVHRVHLLLEQVFRKSKIQMVTVLINPAGASIIDQFSRVDEHLLFVHIGTARPQRTFTDTTPGTSNFVTVDGEAKPFRWEPFQRSGGNSRREDTKAKFFPVWIHEETGTIVGCGDHLPEGVDRKDAPPPPPGCVAQWPIKQDGSEACWQLSAPTFRQYLKEGRIKIGTRKKTTGRWGIGFAGKGAMAAIAAGELMTEGRDDKGSLIIKNAEGKVRSQVGKTMWTNGAYSATEHGSTLLRNFLPRRKFPFPKSLYAVEDALRYYIGHKPDAVVLDFFAGSGTTAHAVMRLNRQDGGNRTSISVTNNEVSDEEQAALRRQGHRPGDFEWEALGIFEHITKPRLRAAITGVNSDGKPAPGRYRFADEFPMSEGFEENAAFFTLTYESKWLVGVDRAFAAIAPMLWLRAGARGRIIESLPESGFDVAEAYGVIRDLDRADEFLDALTEHREIRIAYIITDDEGRYQQLAHEIPHLETVRLYEDYLRNCETSGTV